MNWQLRTAKWVLLSGISQRQFLFFTRSSDLPNLWDDVMKLLFVRILFGRMLLLTLQKCCQLSWGKKGTLNSVFGFQRSANMTIKFGHQLVLFRPRHFRVCCWHWASVPDLLPTENVTPPLTCHIPPQMCHPLWDVTLLPLTCYQPPAAVHGDGGSEVLGLYDQMSLENGATTAKTLKRNESVYQPCHSREERCPRFLLSASFMITTYSCYNTHAWLFDWLLPRPLSTGSAEHSEHCTVFCRTPTHNWSLPSGPIGCNYGSCQCEYLLKWNQFFEWDHSLPLGYENARTSWDARWNQKSCSCKDREAVELHDTELGASWFLLQFIVSNNRNNRVRSFSAWIIPDLVLDFFRLLSCGAKKNVVPCRLCLFFFRAVSRERTVRNCFQFSFPRCFTPETDQWKM